jgi:NADH:ubiquinone oxidoreductase subunit 5 (subunit L)/multisubunit Na+/H+ antiporter MnhA subunit
VSNAGDGHPAGFSWARSTETPQRRSLAESVRWRLRDLSWFDVIAALVTTAIFDFVVGLIISAYFGTECHDVCTLHQRAHEDRMLMLLLPLLLGAPPVLVALLLRRMRVLIAFVQLVTCVLLVTHAALDLRTVDSRIHGTARCWNPLYSDKDCPWGPV